jgi:hypothetical protein
VFRKLQQQLQEDPKTFFRRLSPAPSDFSLPKIKIELKGRIFETAEEIQAEMQTVLNTITKNNSRMQSKSDRNAGIGVCAPMRTTLKVIMQNDIQVRRNTFYLYIYFGNFSIQHVDYRLYVSSTVHKQEWCILGCYAVWLL